MKRVVSSRTPGQKLLAMCVFVALLAAGLLLAACAPDASTALISPELGEQLKAQLAGEEIVREPTPVPPKLAELSEEQIYAGMPEDLAAAVQAVDPAGGAQIALSNTVQPCSGCHNVDASAQTVGPTWHNVGDTAVVHAAMAGIAGPAEYLHQSIVDPNAFIVPSYQGGLMNPTYGTGLSQDEIATLIAYLLDQNGQP